MSKAQLSHHAYGKHQVRVSKVRRSPKSNSDAELHEFIEASVNVSLEGDFAAAYTDGDNRNIIATDTCKNTVYAIAKDAPLETIESFGVALAEHFVNKYAHVSQATIELREQRWRRLLDCPHAFTGSDGETPTATVMAKRGEKTAVLSGLENLVLAKTTESGFSDFHSDEFRTLPDTDDRVFATALAAKWEYTHSGVQYAECRKAIRHAMLARFIDHYSRSVQETLMFMGKAALDACEQIDSINLSMPNKHHLLVDLQPLKRENKNEVFSPTEAPYGWITGTVDRKE